MAAHMFSKWLAVCLLLGFIAACGRAGDLEPPPSSSATPAQSDEANGEDEAEDRPFVLDGLL